MRKNEPTTASHADILEKRNATLAKRIEELDVQVAGLVAKELASDGRIRHANERREAADKLAEVNRKNGEEWKSLSERLTIDLENSNHQHRQARGDASFWRGVAFGLDAEKAKAAVIGRDPPALQRVNRTSPAHSGDLYSDRF